MRSSRNSEVASGCGPTSTTLSNDGKKMQRLTQQQLEAWWPFTRLDPRLFPKAPKQTDHLDDVEDAPW